MKRNKNFISTKGLSRDEWLQLRKEIGIGGSEAAAVLGYSQYSTPVDVWINKTSESLMSVPDNEAMWIGREIEPMLRKRFTEETGLRVFEDHKIRIHPDHPCLFCNLDGMVINTEKGTGVFEAKAFMSYELDKYEAVIPPYVYLQVQHNMSVSGFGYGYVIVWIKDKNKFLVQPVSRNEKLILDMNQALVKFWEYNVKGYHAPSPTNEEDLKKLFTPGEEGKKIEATPEVLEWVDELLKTRDKTSALGNKESMLRYQIESFMKDAEILVDDQGETLITWNTSKQFNEAALAEDEPELYEKFSIKFDRGEFKKLHKPKDDQYMERTGPRKFLIKDKN